MEGKPPELPSLQQEAVSEKTSSDRLKELAGISQELARLVASNPGATPELLRELAGSRDPHTRQNVAANPNTPTEVLLKLGEEFPQEVVNNPVFSLLFLENPNILNEMPVTALRNLLKQEGVPVFFLEYAAHSLDAEVQMAVATNAQTPSAALQKLAKSRYSEVAEAARLHVNLAGEITEDWDERAKTEILNTEIGKSYWDYLESLANTGAIPYFVIQTFPENCELLHQIASNPHTPGRTLEELVKDRDWEIRLAVAANPRTPARSLALLCQDKNWWVRWEVARNPSTPARVLEHLALREVRSEVQLAVAAHAQTTVSALQKLLKSRYSKVAAVARLRLDWAGDKKKGWLEEANQIIQNTELGNKDIEDLENLAKTARSGERAMASNISAEGKMLEDLAREKNWQVRLEVAKNPNTPETILEYLARDSEFWVRLEVAHNPNTPGRILEELVMDDYSQLRSLISEKTDPPASLIADILGPEAEFWIAVEVAQNPNTPVSLLERLAKHNQAGVRESVAKNYNLTASLIKQLAEDEDFKVICNLALNPNTPASILEKFARARQGFWVNVSIASNPNITASIQELLVKSKDPSVLKNLASNPSTTLSILEQLVSDVDSGVRQVAIAPYLARKPEGLPLVMEHYNKDDKPSFKRLMVMLHPEIPAQFLAQNVRWSVWLERYAITQHANTPLNTLEVLARDSNRIVRAAAKANLQGRS